MADRRPLIHETSDLSESSDNTPALPTLAFSNICHSLGFTHISPPTSPPASRPSYSRFQSDATAVERNTPSTIVEDEEEDVADSFRRQNGSGLGIAAPDVPVQTARRVSIQTIPRKSIGPGPKSPPTKSPGALSPPDSADPFFGGFPKDSSSENTPDLRRDRLSPDVGTFEEFRRGVLKNARQSSTSVDDYQHYLEDSDTQRLRGAPSIKSAYENDFRPSHECPTTRDFYHSRFTWLNMSVLVLCLFSCVFSGVFVVLALKGPRYGRRITSQGSFKPADAILLTTVMAKAIELSFVTAFVAFLGQVLSRRAFMKDDGRGVTLSELSMWRWVVQPGTLITHWETAKYAGLSLLGILSLLSAVLATLYSSAATALVQPMLKDGMWDSMVMAAQIKTDFANVNYVKKLCQTPIRSDEKNAGSTCLQIEHAGQGYHNYQRYLADWDTTAANGNGTTDQKKRPPGFGLFYENTTVTAQWINIVNTTEISKEHGRAVNDVSLAMPHSGVFAAARDERNGILQPEELNSEGTYSLRASVPSPVMNVVCANMNEEELKPIVYDTWNDELVNITTWQILWNNATTTNKTKVDSIFGWDDKERVNYPPVFAKYPKPFNTIMNHTSHPWGRPSIYLLGQGGAEDDGTDATGVYVLCKIHVSLTPECSTRYNVTGSGGTMEALCEDKTDNMAYLKSQPDAEYVKSITNWRDIGSDWSNSLSLNTGIVDADASNSRLLTQLILKPSNPDPKDFQVDLNPALPSVGEALAVMSGCTLLKSTLDAPFVMFWNYTASILEEPQTQYFNASLKAQQYASGGVDHASKGWLVILILVFLMNIFVLIYFILHRGLVTDFSEPPNLFALAVNSPPSHVLAGSCGGGPEGKQYMVNWFVNHEGSHLFMEPGEKTHLLSGHREHPHVHVHGPVEELTPSDVKTSNGRLFASIIGTIKQGLGIKERPPTKLRPVSAVESLRAPSTRPLSMAGSEYEMEDGHTRTQRQYQKLANRRSML
ncbi:Nn.00g093890.m01.CDS01 [Neocucurbitaria sp. VM-36]